MRKSTACCDKAVAARKKTQQRPAGEDGGGDAAAKACKGRVCRSCAGGLVADCVAVCCCPCAVLQLLALAFVKLPWTLGSKCLGGGKMGGRRRRMQIEGNERKCRRSESECVIERGRRAGESRHRPSSTSPGPAVVSENDRVVDGHGSLGEREWSALHDDQVGHLAFGRDNLGNN